MNKDILLPLRRIHGQFHEWRIKRKEAKQLRRMIGNASKPVALIVGTPDHENIGDSAIACAEAAFLQKMGFDTVEITTNEYRLNPMLLSPGVVSDSLICFHGGGNMGNQWHREELFRHEVIQKLPRNPIVIFPQTLYYTPDAEGAQKEQASVAAYNGRGRLTMVVREQTSFDKMRQLYPNIHVMLIPDIVLSADMDTFGAKPHTRNGVLLCMRADVERSMTDEDRRSIEQQLEQKGLPFRYTDMMGSHTVTKENRLVSVREKMEEFTRARLVITDRLHGMVFAAITGTPCIVFSNYNHKVRGTYEWIQNLDYIHFADSVSEVSDNCSRLYGLQNCKFDNRALQPYYEKLAEVMKNYVQN